MSERTRVLIGSAAAGRVPAGADEPATVLLDLGPDHPSRAGLLELRLWREGDLITRAEARIGMMHRGAEKLFEVRDYRQILMLADRHDWHAPFSGELVVALACEELMGLEVPERARWLRTLLAEHTRMLSHLGFLSWVESDGSTLGLRERLRSQTRDLSGNRIHPMLNRIGGLAADAGPDWLAAEERLAADIAAAADALEFVIDGLPSGVAPVADDVVAAYGLSGPIARAGGRGVDLRPGYLAYAELDVDLDPQVSDSDARGRLRVLARELAISARLVTGCAQRLRAMSGPVSVKLPKIVKLPDAETYRCVEAPLGVAGVFLVSRGEKTPWRLRLRTPSFATVSAFEAVLPGCRVPDLELALASLGWVIGDVDK